MPPEDIKHFQPVTPPADQPDAGTYPQDTAVLSAPPAPVAPSAEAPAAEDTSPEVSAPAFQSQAPIVQPQPPAVPKPFEPVVSAPYGPSAPLPPTPKKSKKGLLVATLAVLLVLVLGSGGALGYMYYQKQMAAKEFNDIALQVKTQELAGARNYVKVAATVDELAPLMAFDGSSGINQNVATTLNKNADSIAAAAAASCKAKASDLTPAAIDQKMKGLPLNDPQKRYISDMKQVIDGLSQSQYSNAGICREGPAFAAMVHNLANVLPGLSLLVSVGGGSMPTDAQMNTLKAFTNASLIGEADMQPLVPQTVKFLKDIQAMMGDLYYELAAVKAGDMSSALTYDTKISDLSGQLSTDSQNMDTEVKNLDKADNDAATKASLTEIAAIDYQTGHKTANANMQLDYALPAFRIAEAAVTSYSDAHSGSYPYGSSIESLAGIDSNLQQLQKAGHLKNLAYSSQGSDQSGFSLSATLADGTKLTEELNTSALQSL